MCSYSAPGCINVSPTTLALVRAEYGALYRGERAVKGKGNMALYFLTGRLNPATEAVEARAACARYLALRIQSHADMKPGRTPDMSPAAAAATKAVLAEVGSTAWEPLYGLPGRGGAGGNVTGAAAMHSKEARMEGATRILGNHFHLLLDVCNPSKHLNIPKPGDQYAPQSPTEASTAFGRRLHGILGWNGRCCVARTL